MLVSSPSLALGSEAPSMAVCGLTLRLSCETRLNDDIRSHASPTRPARFVSFNRLFDGPVTVLGVRFARLRHSLRPSPGGQHPPSDRGGGGGPLPRRAPSCRVQWHIAP